MIAKIFVAADLVERTTVLDKQLESFGLKREHPDVLYIAVTERLGVEQARIIKEFLAFKPFQAMGRGVVIEDLSGITVDAQNALLKVLEEPPLEAVILLGTPNTNYLLPTVLSRCEIVLLDSESKAKDFSQIEKILSLDTEGRFKAVEKSDDREKLLEDLILYIEQDFQQNSQRVSMAKKALEAEGWQKANVNVRGILEYLMLVL